MRLIFLVIIFVLHIFFAASVLAFQDQEYAIIDVGSLGGTSTVAYGINESGWIVGSSFIESDRDYHAYLWNQKSMTDLGTFGGEDSRSNDLNEIGQIVGIASLPGGSIFTGHAFLWEDNYMLDLGTLGGDQSNARAINNSGQIVGNSQLIPGEGLYHAVLWDDNGITELESLEPTNSSDAFKINNNGIIAGMSWYQGTKYWYNHAVIWSAPNEITDLGTLEDSDAFSQAYDINDLNHVVGYSEYRHSDHTFLWMNGVMHDIHVDYWEFPYFDESYPWGVNNYGQIVGVWASSVFEGKLLFLMEYEPEVLPIQYVVSLASLLPPLNNWELTYVQDINDAGQIIGTGERAGDTYGYLLSPVYPSCDLSQVEPAIAGQVNGIQVTNLRPNVRVYIVFGFEGGGALIPGCDASINALQIDNPEVAGSAVTDENGTATFYGKIPASWAGKDVLFQAVVVGGFCEISNLVVQRFE